MNLEAGISESKNLSAQTDSNLLTLAYLKRKNPSMYGHLPDVDDEQPKHAHRSTESERMLNSIKYYRETSSLGGVVG